MLKTVKLQMNIVGKADVLNKYCYSLFSDTIIPYDNYEIFSIPTPATESKYVKLAGLDNDCYC